MKLLLVTLGALFILVLAFCVISFFWDPHDPL